MYCVLRLHKQKFENSYDPVTAHQIEISHISWYNLTYHNTLLTVLKSPLEKSNITKPKILFLLNGKGLVLGIGTLNNYCKKLRIKNSLVFLRCVLSKINSVLPDYF